MFFWPIWTKSAPLPKDLEESKDNDNKMFFWPIWTARSNIPFPKDMDENMDENSKMLWNRMLSVAEVDAPEEVKDNDNKMFFWPIWTKSAPLPKDLEESKDNDNKMFFWPIWTARSNIPFPKDMEESKMQISHLDFKMHLSSLDFVDAENADGKIVWSPEFWLPRSTFDVHDDSNNNKKFFWPIWTKSKSRSLFGGTSLFGNLIPENLVPEKPLVV